MAQHHAAWHSCEGTIVTIQMTKGIAVHGKQPGHSWLLLHMGCIHIQCLNASMGACMATYSTSVGHSSSSKGYTTAHMTTVLILRT